MGQHSPLFYLAIDILKNKSPNLQQAFILASGKFNKDAGLLYFSKYMYNFRNALYISYRLHTPCLSQP